MDIPGVSGSWLVLLRRATGTVLFVAKYREKEVMGGSGIMNEGWKEETMWNLISVSASDPGKVKDFLNYDYEPFAVSQDMGGERIWLKKRIENEIYSSKPRRSNRGRSTEDTPSPKAKAGS
jgi:hypothetical protein